MKTINVKIPVEIACDMDNRARLNPQWLTTFIMANWSYVGLVQDTPIKDLTYNYSFKVPAELHKLIKLQSTEMDIPMNELIGRLLARFYKEVE